MWKVKKIFGQIRIIFKGRNKYLLTQILVLVNNWTC